MSTDRILSRLRKVKALSEKGVAGEKENAIKLLFALKKKYRIKRITQDLKEREFVCKDKYERILVIQCVYNWFDGKIIPYTFDNTILVTINDEDFICLSEFISFHKSQYLKNKSKLLIRYTDAYLNKHRIFSSDSRIKFVSHKVFQELDTMSNFISGRKFSKKQKQLKGAKI